MAKKKTTKKATTKKTTMKRPTTRKEVLVVGSKLKAALKGNGKKTFNVSGDTLEAMNEYMYWLVDQAQRRAEANGRKTIRPHDILAQ